MTDLKQALAEIKSRLEKATPVVSWYAHPREIRGPFNRWFTIKNPDELIQNGRVCRASAEADIDMFAHAPTDLARLIKVVELMSEALEKLAQMEDQLAKAGYPPSPANMWGTNALAAAVKLMKGEE